MVTEVIMKRELFGCEISQKSKSEFFSATDLVLAGNKWRLANNLPLFNMSTWFQNPSVKDFMEALKKQYGTIKINSKGKNDHTWVHPFIFIDMALAISPELKIEVYSWIYDHLLKYRNESGDSYKKMAGSIYNNTSNKSNFPKQIEAIAYNIKTKVGVMDWSNATEDQLKKRDRIHENISLLADILPIDEAVRIGILKGLSEK